ncbi:MAG TPA: formate transporter FocA [Alphaproteobacteria bacterium]|nr:formate transporter FocA [Alphaproteobacteria bacterium]
MMDEPVGLDAYAPADMAARVEAGGVAKANLDTATVLALAVLAGAFIALGANFATIVLTDSGSGYGLSRLAGGLVFSLGLILVLVGGAELFTGNILMVMAWASGKVSTLQLLRNWAVVYAGNFIGALATAGGVYLSHQWTFAGYRVGATALTIAHAKVQYDFVAAFILGVFCNALVCLAVWLSFSARTTTDKILAIIPPIAAFVAVGFEHSIANMYFIPLGLWLRADARVLEMAGRLPEQVSDLTWMGFFGTNLLPVTLGNLVGGGVLVAAVYWFVYLRRRPANRFVQLWDRWRAPKRLSANPRQPTAEKQ